MPITAYSQTFKRELDVTQLERLFMQSPHAAKGNFRDFVRTDIECPTCNVTGGYLVTEGLSSVTGKVVKQACFAFRNNANEDAHLPFCDFYTGPDKLQVAANESQFSYGSSNSPITSAIREMVCIGIENGIFSQADIRDMREWFLELRQSKDFTFDLTPHIVNIAKTAFSRSERNWHKYIVEPTLVNEEWFNLNDEVYESLYFKFPKLRLDYEDNPEVYNIRLKSIIKKTRNIIIKESGIPTFDRELLTDKYKQVWELAIIIRNSNKLLKKKISSIPSNNPLMALSALLLYVSNWDEAQAISKFNQILEIGKVDDIDAGNVMGLNPFIHYSAWIIVKKLHELTSRLPEPIDFEAEFEAEKSRLKALYYPD
ncbi:hypothetical protein ACUCI8_003023 [Yersinia enterocolitica]|nr:hypothetical protein [Yersinia enterocolitica]HDL8224217.1 hypothetical protein [Yersinia enterocolitica]HEN3490874.1 hypothetical protein [Yersinia enterocolitica]